MGALDKQIRENLQLADAAALMTIWAQRNL